METPVWMDSVLVVFAISILLGGMVMLFSGTRSFGDK